MKIPKKEDMRQLERNVYTDGIFAYKFYDTSWKGSNENEAEALRRVQDIDGTQKFVHYDDSEKVIVTELIKGHILGEESEEYKTGDLKYTPSQLEAFFSTLVQMGRRGVIYEAHTRNLFYDDSDGFTPLDYEYLGPVRDPWINLRGVLETLSLRSVPVLKGGNLHYGGSGVNSRENLPVIRSMVYDAFRTVDQVWADREINSLAYEKQTQPLIHSSETTEMKEVKGTMKNITHSLEFAISAVAAVGVALGAGAWYINSFLQKEHQQVIDSRATTIMSAEPKPNQIPIRDVNGDGIEDYVVEDSSGEYRVILGNRDSDLQERVE